VQYTGITRPACFENVLTTDWGSATNTVDTSRYAQFSNYTAHTLITPLPDLVPPCEYNWDMPFAEGGAPVNHESASQEVRVFAFDDLDADGVRDIGEPLLGAFTFTVMPQSLMASTGMLEGASTYSRTATTTNVGAAVFPNTHAGNYLVSVSGRPGLANPCAFFNAYTTPRDLTSAGVTAPWTAYFTVGGPSQFDGNIYVGVDCQ